MAKSGWSTPLPRPIAILDQHEDGVLISDQYLLTLRTLADVRKLLSHIPKERRELSTWQHVEKTLHDCAAGEDPVNISVALQIVLQAERVPYQVTERGRRSASGRWAEYSSRADSSAPGCRHRTSA
jgi:hypothetical protein